MILDTKIVFHEYFQIAYLKGNKILELPQNLQNQLPRSALITIYKPFFRPQFDYGHIFYDQAFNAYHQKLESIQVITGATRATTKETSFRELGLGSLPLRSSYRKQSMFYKIYINQSPQYIVKLMPEKSSWICYKKHSNITKNTSSKTLSFLLQSLNEFYLDFTLRNSKMFCCS